MDSFQKPCLTLLTLSTLMLPQQRFTAGVRLKSWDTDCFESVGCVNSEHALSSWLELGHSVKNSCEESLISSGPEASSLSVSWMSRSGAVKMALHCYCPVPLLFLSHKLHSSQACSGCTMDRLVQYSARVYFGVGQMTIDMPGVVSDTWCHVRCGVTHGVVMSGVE